MCVREREREREKKSKVYLERYYSPYIMECSGIESFCVIEKKIYYDVKMKLIFNYLGTEAKTKNN